MPGTEEQWRLAGHVAGCADLRDVRLFSFKGDLPLPDTSRGLGYSLDVQVEYQTLGDEVVNALVVSGNYTVLVTESVDEGAADDEPVTVASLEFTLAAMYVLLEQDREPQSFDDEEFEAFSFTTGQYALYPYAREFVANMTGRMGLPPLHLGTLRFDRDEFPEE